MTWLSSATSMIRSPPVCTTLSLAVSALLVIVIFPSLTPFSGLDVAETVSSVSDAVLAVSHSFPSVTDAFHSRFDLTGTATSPPSFLNPMDFWTCSTGSPCNSLSSLLQAYRAVTPTSKIREIHNVCFILSNNIVLYFLLFFHFVDQTIQIEINIIFILYLNLFDLLHQ